MRQMGHGSGSHPAAVRAHLVHGGRRSRHALRRAGGARRRPLDRQTAGTCPTHALLCRASGKSP